MALVIKDRVKETSTITGTGPYTLVGSEAGFQGFSTIGDGNTTYYTATDNSDWEIGIGTYTASGSTLARTTILSSSNSNNSVNWTAGEKFVFITQPASKANFLDADGFITGTEVKTDLDFNTTIANKPSYSEGKLFYDKFYGALSFYNDEADISLPIGQTEYLRIFNNTGSTITEGTPVYQTGGQTDHCPYVAPAVANDTYLKSQAVGLASHDIETGTKGYIIVRGLIPTLDTSMLTVGSLFHLGVSGGLQTAAPTYPFFPTELGICLIVNATAGCVYVNPVQQSIDALRVVGNSHFDNDLTVVGDLVVQGTQTITNSNNISLSGAWNYFNNGDTISDITFTGTGLNDMIFTGHYTGTASNRQFSVRIDDDSGVADKFEWSLDNFNTTEATNVTITGEDQSLQDGISVKFNAVDGHTDGNKWQGTASPTNVDTGIASNRNTGTTGVGFTHVGMYYDINTDYWTFFNEYGPEPTGTINTGDATFSYGSIKVDTVFGDVTGAVTGNATSASQLETARVLSLSGDVTGTMSFNGTANADLVATVVNDSHTHDTQYVQLAGDTMTGTLNVPTVDLGDWSISETSGVLEFSYQGTKRLSLDSTGSLKVSNQLQADETIT